MRLTRIRLSTSRSFPEPYVDKTYTRSRSTRGRSISSSFVVLVVDKDDGGKLSKFMLFQDIQYLEIGLNRK